MMDFLNCLQARRASNVVERFEQDVATNIENRLKSLDRQISGPRGLTAKMAVLELTVLNGNMSASSTRPVRLYQVLYLTLK